MKQKYCKICGFPLGCRPNLYVKDDVCGACLNHDIKKDINFEERQQWLTEYIQQNKNKEGYDALIAVSGGKDSHMIVKRLMENHGIFNPLLVTCLDEFTITETGKQNLKNISEHFDVDHIFYRYKPKTAKKQMLNNFEEYLNPMIDFENRTVGSSFPIEIARKFNINLVFYGENAAFEYGNIGQDNLKIFHPDSDEKTSIIFMGAIYPYSIKDSLTEASSVGFKDLDYFGEWDRQGQIENSTQIETYGYLISQWTKYVKFGAQRVADIASRLVREGSLTREQAIKLTNENDYICDPKARRDFCNTLGIDEDYFFKIVGNHVNPDAVGKDCNGNWKRKDLLEK